MKIQVTVTLPDDLAGLDSNDVSRDVLEQVVAESYRNGQLSLKQVRELLGLPNRFAAEDFIHRHRSSGYGIDELKEDLNALEDLGLK
jgi:predicted HTH domain antitoxin